MSMAGTVKLSRAFGGGLQPRGFDFRIGEGATPALMVRLHPGATFVAESGGLMMKDSRVSMTLGVGNGGRQGLLSKIWSLARRRIAGEALLTQKFTNATQCDRDLYLVASYPGDILAIDLRDFGGSVLCQRGAFMAGPGGTDVKFHLRQSIGFALFGKENLVMQKITGDNVVFLNAGGGLESVDLAAGDAVDIDTGCLVATTRDVSTTITKAGSWGSAFWGGEGFFLVHCKGPGRVWAQTMPFSREVAAITREQKRQAGKSPGFLSDDPK